MSLKNTLTNEKLSKRFDNPFALVNFAIGLAKEYMQGHQEQENNLANEVLEAIAVHQENSWKIKEKKAEEEFDLE